MHHVQVMESGESDVPCAESQFCATLLGEPMAPVGAAERSALEGFFRSRRGQRVLIVPPAADARSTLA